MLKISIFTPTNNVQFLPEAYNSIKNQNFDEWVIILNGQAKEEQLPKNIIDDKRVKTFQIGEISGFVGALKRYACSKCTGDVLIELDHDDLLTPDAISEIRDAFKDPKIGFVYSNSCNFKDKFEPTTKYGEQYGWKYREYDHFGHKLDEAIAFKEYPSGLSKIWYCPNHVRAWRTTDYWKAGGHPADMRVLDDQDLILRTYLVTQFKHIDKCLYLYRITGTNTWLKYNDEIQNNTLRLRSKYLEEISLQWAKNNNLLALDMGASHNPRKGFQTCDINEGCNYQFDANKEWPFKDNSVGVLRMYDFMEHIPDKIHLINEAYRVLAHGGLLLSETPSTDGRGAFQDPTHCAFYNENSFWYYTKENVQKYVPEIKARFQTENIETFIKQDSIPYVRAHMISIKGNNLPGAIEWDRNKFPKV